MTMMFGARIKRREDPRLITGQATYVDDIKLPGTLHLVMVRSPHAHARIKKIDASKAASHPGVVAVFTGAELQEQLGSLPVAWLLPDLKQPPHPPMAVDTVRYVGDVVAAVVAEDAYTASDAVGLVQVEYEPLPIVVNAEKAMESGAPQLHPEAPNNIAWEWDVKGGDYDAAVNKRGVVVVKERLINQRLIPNAMETRGVVADYTPSTNQLTMWTSTQIPHLVRLFFSLMTGHPENQIRVIAPEVGGAFGSKLYIYAEEVITGIIAKQLGRPVKWIEGRQENYMATTHGRDHITDVEIAGRRDGTILGIKCTVRANLGAYLSTFATLIPTYYFGLMLVGVYKTPNISCKVYGVFTNTTPVDAYRGAGRPEAAYLVERMVDRFALEIRKDPVEVRRKNLIPPFDNGYAAATGVIYDSGNYEATLNRALEMVGYEKFRQEQKEARERGRYLGIGLSTYIEISGAAPSAIASTLGAQGGLWESSRVRVHVTGKVTVFIGTSPHGQGHETSFAQLAASELGVPIEDVEVIHGDTGQVQQGVGTFGSRSGPVGGTAVYLTLGKIKEKAKQIAAHHLEVDAEHVIFENGKFVVEDIPEKSMSFQEAALEAYLARNLPEGMEPGLEEVGFYDPPNFTWPFGAHIAVVEVDPDTGDVKLLRFVAVDDVGKVINPMIVDGMVQGGIAQGVGQALLEQAIYDDEGQLLTGSMLDYTVPTAEVFPSFEVERTETPSPSNPLGVKGAGETGTVAASPAVVNAVVDALAPLGVKHIDMPVTSEKVWRIFQERRGRRRRRRS